MKEKKTCNGTGQRVNEVNASFVVVSKLSAESLSLNVTEMEVLLRVKKKKTVEKDVKPRNRV